MSNFIFGFRKSKLIATMISGVYVFTYFTAPLHAIYRRPIVFSFFTDPLSATIFAWAVITLTSPASSNDWNTERFVGRASYRAFAWFVLLFVVPILFAFRIKTN